MTMSFLVTLLLSSCIELRVLIFLRKRKSMILAFVCLWNIENLSLQSITFMGNFFNQIHVVPIFTMDYTYSLPPKHNLRESSPSPNFSMVLQYHNSKLKLCGFSWHVWGIRKQLDPKNVANDHIRSYKTNDHRTMANDDQGWSTGHFHIQGP